MSLASEVAATVTVLNPWGGHSIVLFFWKLLLSASDAKLCPATFSQKLICWMKMGMIKGGRIQILRF